MVGEIQQKDKLKVHSEGYRLGKVNIVGRIFMGRPAGSSSLHTEHARAVCTTPHAVSGPEHFTVQWCGDVITGYKL